MVGLLHKKPIEELQEPYRARWFEASTGVKGPSNRLLALSFLTEPIAPILDKMHPEKNYMKLSTAFASEMPSDTVKTFRIDIESLQQHSNFRKGNMPRTEWSKPCSKHGHTTRGTKNVKQFFFRQCPQIWTMAPARKQRSRISNIPHITGLSTIVQHQDLGWIMICRWTTEKTAVVRVMKICRWSPTATVSCREGWTGAHTILQISHLMTKTKSPGAL